MRNPWRTRQQTPCPFPRIGREHLQRATLDLRGKKVSAFVFQKVTEKLSALEDETSDEEVSVEVAIDHYQGLDNDIAAFGKLTGYKIEHIRTEAEVYQRYIITRKTKSALSSENLPNKPTGTTYQRNGERQHLALIISKDGLEELLSPLGFALTAATLGWKVSIYFQGPGVHVLDKTFRGHLTSWWMKPFSGIARKKMADMGHSPPSEKLEQLQQLGAKFYACHPSMDIFGVSLEQTRFPADITVCEYATFLDVLQDSTVQLGQM